jgi:hypothetical protein
MSTKEEKTIEKKDIKKYLERGWVIVGMFDKYYTVERQVVNARYGILRSIEELFEDMEGWSWEQELNKKLPK